MQGYSTVMYIRREHCEPAYLTLPDSRVILV